MNRNRKAYTCQDIDTTPQIYFVIALVVVGGGGGGAKVGHFSGGFGNSNDSYILMDKRGEPLKKVPWSKSFRFCFSSSFG